MATQTLIEGFVCRYCLFDNRSCQDLLRHRCKSNGKHNFCLTATKTYVRWNGTFLEPAPRTLPESESLNSVRNIVLCHGGRRCKLEQCTFAHDTKELKYLNDQLKKIRKENPEGSSEIQL